MKVLITGANGFLGASVAQELMEPQIGCRFVVFQWSGRSEGNFLSSSDRDRVLANSLPDAVVHCAWHSIRQKRYEHADAHSQWADATQDFAAKCTEQGVHFVHLGSAVDCLTPTSDHLNGSQYSISKQRLRLLVLAQSQDFPQSTWLSPQYVFSESAMRPRLLRNLLESPNPAGFTPNHPFALHDYMHVNDFATAVRKVLRHKLFGPVYVGCGLLFTNQEFVATAKFRLGLVSHRPRVNARLSSRLPSYLKSTGWTPQATFSYFGLEKEFA